MCKNSFFFGLFWNSNAQKGSQGWTWGTLFEPWLFDAIGAADALLEGATRKASKTFIQHAHMFLPTLNMAIGGSPNNNLGTVSLKTLVYSWHSELVGDDCSLIL